MLWRYDKSLIEQIYIVDEYRENACNFLVRFGNSPFWHAEHVCLENLFEQFHSVFEFLYRCNKFYLVITMPCQFIF